MSKAVKAAVTAFIITFAVVTGTAFLLGGSALGIFGVSATAMATLSAVSTLVGGLLSKGVDAVGENFGSKVSTRTATAPRQIIYGKARVGGTITHIETSGTDKYKLSMIVVLAGHEVESLEEFLINDEVLTTTSNGGFEYATNNRFTNSDNDNKFSVQNSLLRYVFLDGSQTTANNNVISNTSLGNTDKFIGVSYVFVEMVFDSEAFGGGIPPMSFVVKGKKVFDPRTNETAFIDSTGKEIGSNPALCVRDYITNTTYGLKATSSEVNDTLALGSFKVAANTCEGDQPITTATVSGAVTTSRIVNLAIADTVTLIDVGQKVTGAGISNDVYVLKRTNLQLTLTANVSLSNNTTLTFTEKAYTANGITNMSADGGGVIEGLLSSCAGKLSYIDGKFVMFAGANVYPNMTITDDNLLAPITVQTAQSSGETFNSVKAVYVDANNNYVATDSPLYEDSTLLANDTPSGESSANYKKSLEIQLPFTDTTTMAQRLQRTALLHTRKKTSLSVSCNIAFMQLQPFDWVYLTNERLGYTNKTFEVLSTNLEVIDQDGVPVLATRLDLKEIDSSVYNFASSSYTNPLDEGSSVSTGSFAVSPPTSLAVATTLEITGFDLNVSWTNNPDDLVQGTEVFYGTTSGTYIGSFIVGKSTAKESINGVGASTTYYVAVRHFSSNNVFSALTSEVSVTTGTAPISYSTGGGAVGNSDTLNVLGKNLVLNRFNSTSGGEDNENYTFLNSGNGALGGITSFQNSDTERVQLFFGEDIGGDFTNQFIALDADWDLGKGGANGSSTGTSKLIIKGKAYGSSTGSAGATSTIATFNAITNTDGYAFPTVELAPTTISGSTTTPVVVVSQGSAPSTTTNKLYNVGGSLYWNGAVVDTGAGDITGVTITTSGQSGLTGGASFASGDATFTLAIASSIDGSKTFTDDVVVQGDLTVEGTTTTIDTTNLDVQDKNITLNYGTGDTSANANGAGITIQDAVSATQDATLTWNTTNDSFNFSHNLNFANNVKAQFGDGDLQIYSAGNYSVIDNLTNNLVIRNQANNSDIILQSDDGAGSLTDYLKIDGSTGETKLFHYGSEKISTKSSGANITGNIVADGGTIDGIFIVDGGTGVASTGVLNVRQSGDGAGNGIAITSSHATSHRIFKNASGVLNIGSSSNTNAFQQDLTGNITIEGTIDSGAITSDGLSVNSGTTNQVATFSSTDATAFIKVADNSTTASAHGYGVNGNDLSLYANDSERVRIKSTGDVNLKTGALQIGGQTVISSARNITAGTIDSGAIDATGSISTTGSITSTNGTVDLYDNAGNKPKIKFREDGSDAFILEYNGDGSGTGNYVAFYSNVTGWVSKGSGLNYIPANGRVGIGLTNPSEKLSVVGNISVTGTVDGRDIATDGTKLDGIEAGATTDQTQAEINALGITAIGLSGTPNITVGTINSGAIDVTGAVTSDGLTVDGVGSLDNNGLNLELSSSNTGIIYDAQNGYHTFKRNGTNALQINGGNGDIAFYDDSGTSQNMVWDASEDRLNFKDGTKSTFGTGNDLQIYHVADGNSLIANFTNTLVIRNLADDQDVAIQSDNGSGGTTDYFRADGSTGETKLFHYGSEKIATKSTGIDVTGTVVADEIKVGASDRIYLDGGSNTFIQESASDDLRFFVGGQQAVRVRTSGTDILGTVTSDGLTINGVESPMIELTDLSTSNELQIYTDNSGGVIRTSTDDDLFLRTNSLNRIKLDNGGDISFYNDTGTAKLLWDASTERLGIGTTAPTRGIHLKESDGWSQIRLEGASGSGGGDIRFGDNTTEALGKILYAINGNYMQFVTNSQTALTINSSQNASFAGTINSGNITAGSSGNSAFLRAYYGSDYMTLQGYGLEMNRTTSYIRPTTDGNKTLYIGGANASLDWAAIHFRSLLGLYMTGTQFLTTDRNLVNIGTISSGNIIVNTTSSGNQITLQAPTPSIEFIDSQATSRKAKISAENGSLLFEADTNTGEANTAITFKMDGANALSFNNSKNANFANDVTVTNDLNVGQQITASGGITTDQSGQTISGFSTIRVGDALIGQDVATLTTTSASVTNRILASATTYRTLKVLVQIKSSTNFHATEILLTHNGTTVYMTEYATIFSNTSLATFDADISGGNIRLLIDPNQSASTEFKFNVSGIEA